MCYQSFLAVQEVSSRLSQAVSGNFTGNSIKKRCIDLTVTAKYLQFWRTHPPRSGNIKVIGARSASLE